MTASDRRTILVVDDEPHIVQFTAMNLEVEGFNVATASNGEEALETLEGNSDIDLVVLDVMMPGIDGFETLSRIREQSSVPVIFVTVRGDETDRVAGLDLGADDYLTKPFSPRELVSRIRALFRRIEATEPPPLQEVVVD
ncbi:MAG: response regulator, partial [Chloroflexi bacterium]|nr:response regulator [Chloroflexota bacterium]